MSSTNDSIAEKAEQLFHGAQHFNCAQAVASAFETQFGVSEALIKDYASKGGGRAEGGMCGALYAARQLLGDGIRADALQEQFETLAGDTTCRQVRQAKKLTCRGCVRTAAALVEEEILATSSEE